MTSDDFMISSQIQDFWCYV